MPASARGCTRQRRYAHGGRAGNRRECACFAGIINGVANRCQRTLRELERRDSRPPYTFMKIAVIGTGYVGLVAGACFAESGNDVICVDKDESKVRTLEDGKMPIYEPGLEEIVRRNRQEGRLSFTTNLASAVRESEIAFIAVGTPQGEDGSADLTHVLGVAREIARAMNGYKVIVDKSTVPVGTSQKVRDVV